MITSCCFKQLSLRWPVTQQETLRCLAFLQLITSNLWAPLPSTVNEKQKSLPHFPSHYCPLEQGVRELPERARQYIHKAHGPASLVILQPYRYRSETALNNTQRDGQSSPMNTCIYKGDSRPDPAPPPSIWWWFKHWLPTSSLNFILCYGRIRGVGAIALAHMLKNNLHVISPSPTWVPGSQTQILRHGGAFACWPILLIQSLVS